MHAGEEHHRGPFTAAPINCEFGSRVQAPVIPRQNLPCCCMLRRAAECLNPNPRFLNLVRHALAVGAWQGPLLGHVVCRAVLLNGFSYLVLKAGFHPKQHVAQ